MKVYSVETAGIWIRYLHLTPAQKAPRPFESPCSLERGAGVYSAFLAITQRHKFLFKPVVPLFHAFACLCGEFQYLKIWIDADGVLLNLCSIKVCIGKEVNLVYKEEGCLAEHKGIFKRLVIPFCGAQQHHLRILATLNSAGQTRLPTFSIIKSSISERGRSSMMPLIILPSR